MSELKRCPFCGKKPQLIEPDDSSNLWSVSCLSCVSIDLEELTEERAIQKWNTRHYPPEVKKALDRMKPKKVIYDDSRLGKPGITEYSLAICPSCRWAVKFEDTASKFCRKCGQALDWSE